MSYLTKYQLADYISEFYANHDNDDLGNHRLHLLMYILFTEYLYVFDVREEEGIIETDNFFPRYLFEPNYIVNNYGVTDPDFKNYEPRPFTKTFPTTFDMQIKFLIDLLLGDTIDIDIISLTEYVLQDPCRESMVNNAPLDINVIEEYYRENSRCFSTRDIFK